MARLNDDADYDAGETSGNTALCGRGIGADIVPGLDGELQLHLNPLDPDDFFSKNNSSSGSTTFSQATSHIRKPHGSRTLLDRELSDDPDILRCVSDHPLQSSVTTTTPASSSSAFESYGPDTMHQFSTLPPQDRIDWYLESLGELEVGVGDVEGHVGGGRQGLFSQAQFLGQVE
ncbi:unnamed protein product [Protopolystoma xenopodis]|uniref:Uncharacterized protein n=1 Tax=Protopolystoma xenopodis TaxID=117903 RepID=A0A448WHJ6_9PLAT|nr:unnamed protein product [Protopolystoma xenopodis]